MADVETAIAYVLRQEDSTLSGVITNTVSDRGGRTRFGVAESAHPELTSSGFYGTMPVPQALTVAKQLYKEAYANRLHLATVANQQVANALLSFAINQGVKTAVECFQKTLGVVVDGNLGPATLVAINTLTPEILLGKLETVEGEHYLKLIGEHPEQNRFRNGWLYRVKQNCTICKT